MPDYTPTPNGQLALILMAVLPVVLITIGLLLGDIYIALHL